MGSLVTTLSFHFLLRFNILIAIFSFINIEIVLFFRYLLPIRNIDSIICILNLLLTDLLEIFPLIALVLTHYVALGGFIILGFSNFVDETWLTCFLTNIYSPHLKLFATLPFWSISLFSIFKVLRQDQVFFIGKLNRGSKSTLSPLSDELMNSSLSLIINLVLILLNLSLLLWSLCGLGYVGSTEQRIALLQLSFLLLLLLKACSLKFYSSLLVLQM